VPGHPRPTYFVGLPRNKVINVFPKSGWIIFSFDKYEILE
jgi:hypothetical protein